MKQALYGAIVMVTTSIHGAQPISEQVQHERLLEAEYCSELGKIIKHYAKDLEKIEEYYTENILLPSFGQHISKALSPLKITNNKKVILTNTENLKQSILDFCEQNKISLPEEPSPFEAIRTRYYLPIWYYRIHDLHLGTGYLLNRVNHIQTKTLFLTEPLKE